jgi:hypothetical protein
VNDKCEVTRSHDDFSLIKSDETEISEESSLHREFKIIARSSLELC